MRIRRNNEGRLGVVVQTLLSRCWSHERIDNDMRIRLTDALSALGADAVVTRFFREAVTLCYSVPSARLVQDDLAQLAKSLDERADVWLDGSKVNEVPWLGHEVVAWPIFQAFSQDLSPAAPETLRGYAGLCFSGAASGARRARFISTEARSSASVLFQVLQQRAQLFLPFAPRMAERYWADAMLPPIPPSQPLRLPWADRHRPVETVSLGFDLRKSTFCMENAANPTAFAYWLDDLVQILMLIGHAYGGAFDKFTGDGGLVHFLEDACQRVDSRSAIDAAVRCALAMQKAVSIHISRLRELLRLDSDLLGGAIGIDTALAYWDLDHRQNPLTVGKGVVGACRLMDKAPAYAVRLTNIAYQKLDKTLRGVFKSVPFTSKEYPAEMKILVWELPDALAMNWEDEVDVQSICELVYADKRRHEAPPVECLH